MERSPKYFGYCVVAGGLFEPATFSRNGAYDRTFRTLRRPLGAVQIQSTSAMAGGELSAFEVLSEVLPLRLNSNQKIK